MDIAPWIGTWLRSLPRTHALLALRELLNRQIPRALIADSVRVVDRGLYRLDTDRGVFLVARYSMSAVLEPLKYVARISAARKGEVIGEEIVVPIHMRYRQDL